MQKLGGLLLIISGLSLGTYTFLPPAHDSEQMLREITRISAAPDRAQIAGQPRLSWVEPAAPASAIPSAEPINLSAASLASPATPPYDGWTAVVTAAPEQKHMTSSQPGDEATRSQLTRDLQRALQRVGCYTGEINGMWTPSSRRAMGTFLERVNATLPLHEPDYILLTMVQSHAGSVCAAACPTGQSPGAQGRCVPDGVLTAQATKSSKRLALKSDARSDHWAAVTVTQDTASERAPSVRTAALSPQGDAAGRRAPASPTVVVHEGDLASPAQSNEQLPWLANDDLSAPVPAPRPIRRPDGMMAIGAASIARADIAEVPSVTGEPRRAKATRKRATVVLYDDLGDDSGVVAPIPRPKSITSQGKRKANSAAGRKSPAPAATAKSRPKKYIYFAGGRRGAPRPGSPAYNMMQAMGGIY